MSTTIGNSSSERWFRLGTFPGVVAFRNCGDAADQCFSILRGWPVQEIPATASDAHVQFMIEKVGNRYDLDMAAMGPFAAERSVVFDSDIFDVVCALHYNLIAWHLADYPDNIWLHCAAVDVGEGLVLLPAPHETGKSALAIAFAQAGHRVYGDDIIGIDRCGGIGFGLGALPRLRKPLPHHVVGEDWLRFVQRYGALQNDHHLYVGLPEDLLAGRGASRPIIGLAMLERSNKKGLVSKLKCRPAEMMRHVLERKCMSRFGASEVFDTLKSLLADKKLLQIKYNRLSDAVAAIEGAFAQDAVEAADG